MAAHVMRCPSEKIPNGSIIGAGYSRTVSTYCADLGKSSKPQYLQRFGFQTDSSDNAKPPSSPVEALSPDTDEFTAAELPLNTEAKHSRLEAVDLSGGHRIYKGSLSSQSASALPDLADLAASDLVPNKYEGGFKLWECALDVAHLLSQLSSLEAASGSLPWKGRMVLELGCGHGLPGILAAILGAEVHFQDYNREVLQRVTMPNWIANIEELHASAGDEKHPRFFSGSWQSLGASLKQLGLAGRYDVVLTTDTIYSLTSQHHLLDCIAQSLKPGGVAYIGAKSYYFGVGGSTQAFKDLSLKRGLFGVELVERIVDGASNVREIIRLDKQRL